MLENDEDRDPGPGEVHDGGVELQIDAAGPHTSIEIPLFNVRE